jgi:hypothetical protein
MKYRSEDDELEEILAFGSEREKAWRRIARGSDDPARGPSRDKPAGHRDYKPDPKKGEKDYGLKEDSEGEETYHYGEDEGRDEKELRDLEQRHATHAHIKALKRDMDYDEDHEDRRERGDHFREGAEDEVDEAKRHVAGGHPDVADFIMPNAPKGKTPPPGQRIMDPRFLKDKTTKVAPVAVPGDDELDTRTRHLNRTKDGKLVPAVRDPEHPDAIKRETKDRWAKIVGDTSPVPPHDLDVSDDERLRWEEDPASFAGFGTPGGGSDEDPHPVRALYSGDKKYDDEDVEYPKDVAAHEKRQRHAFAKQFKENKKISVREAKEITRRIIERIKKESK